jgi:hypothetical protein
MTLSNEDKALIKETSDLLNQLKPLLNKVDKFITNECYQPIDTTEGEQGQGKEWKPKVGEWFKSKFGHLYLCDRLESGVIFGENQNGILYAMDYCFPTTKPLPEEIQAHLVAIAENKYPVGAKYKRMGSLEIIGEIKTNEFIYLPEKNALTEKTGYTVWKDGKWAELAPIETEQRWKPKYDDRYWFVTIAGDVIVASYPCKDTALDKKYYNSGNCFETKEAAQKAAEAIKQYLSTNKF